MSDPVRRLSWDDLRIVKAIGEAGGLAAAAKALGLNHSTLSRRLAAVEEALGVALFDRRRSGYTPTAAGIEMIALGDRVESDILGVARRVSGDVQGYAGDLRVTTSEPMLLNFLMPIIADFQADNPEIRVEAVVGDAPLNLARGDSDIAIRATTTPPPNLFGRKIATVAWTVYCRGIDHGGAPAGLDELYQRQWATYGGGLSSLKAYKFIEDRVPRERIRFRCDSLPGVASAIAAGMGVGILPCMLGDLVPGLVRIGPLIPELFGELWILTHPDIRKSGRVYGFMAHFTNAIAKDREFIEGREVRTAGATQTSRRTASARPSPKSASGARS